MSKRLIILLGASALGVGVLLAGPTLTARGLAWWLQRHADRSGLTLSFREIKAPWFHPVTIRDLRLTSNGQGAAHLEISAPLVAADIHLLSALGWRQGHALRSLQLDHAHISLRGRALSVSHLDWPALASLLPDDFDLVIDSLRLEQPFARCDARNIYLSGSQRRPGLLTVEEVSAVTPFFRQTFPRLRGVTRWQDNHLILASLRLRDGFSLDSLTLDLSRLRQERLAADGALSLFGGLMRANVATERGEKARIWEGAATASGVSLAQLATTLGVTERLAGTVRASKFTFRGDPRDFLHASASVWTELNAFQWRERKADTIMLGANLGDSELQLQELYIKQRGNDLTLSGETPLRHDWLNPDFRGDVAGSIHDLGAFAELFGATAGSLSGKVAVRGRVHTHERKIDGELALTGDGLKIFQAPVTSLTARLTLDGARIRLEQLDCRQEEDFLQGEGEIDFSQHRKFSLALTWDSRDAARYGINLPLAGELTGPFRGRFTAAGDARQSVVTFTANENQLGLETHARREGDRIQFDDLQLFSGLDVIHFAGEVNVAAMDHLRGTFTATQELRLAPSPAPESCVNGIELIPNGEGQTFTKIELNGRDLLFDNQNRLQICDRDQAGGPLRLFFSQAMPPAKP